VTTKQIKKQKHQREQHAYMRMLLKSTNKVISCLNYEATTL